MDGSDSRICLEVNSSQLSQLAKVDPFDPKGHKGLMIVEEIEHELIK
jgi:hypothetical protein